MDKNNSSTQNNPDAICRSHYRYLMKECKRLGLQRVEIDISAHELCYYANGKYYLKSIAYNPTGIALGCPLPNSHTTLRLWRVSILFERFLTELSLKEKKTFAFVPPEYYHVTLVNRSHFKCSTSVFDLSEDLKIKAKDVIDRVGYGPLSLNLTGLILTRSGKLICPGYPIDDELFRLRASIAKEISELRVNLPKIAHIKLGHILVPLNCNKLEALFQSVKYLGELVNLSITFHEVYTPLGPIKLTEQT